MRIAVADRLPDAALLTLQPGLLLPIHDGLPPTTTN